jgi:hypothetical protein
VSWIQVPVRVVSVALKLNMIEEWFELFVFTRRLKGCKPQLRKIVLGLSPMKMLSVSQKLSAIEEFHQDQSLCFAVKITRTKVTVPKICPGFESQ